MLSQHLHLDTDHAGDAVAAEAGLAYRPLSELRGMLARSYGVYCFAWGLATFAACVVIWQRSVETQGLAQASSLAGLSSYMTAGLLGLASVGAGLRTGWGRVLCLAISATLLCNVAWYVSSPSHWHWNGTSAVMTARFLVGWVGMLAFFGTHELFGSYRVGHAVLKESVELAKEVREQDAVLVEMHAAGQRASARSRRSNRAA
ncbi:MAG: hypothetical protein KDB61_01830 [Planctomycetes bacterium]|nr:hypothetical protein [Planctomycetota bacterium]